MMSVLGTDDGCRSGGRRVLAWRTLFLGASILVGCDGEAACDPECSGSRPICADGSCVECDSDATCGAGFCIAHRCSECRTSDDCPDDGVCLEQRECVSVAESFGGCWPQTFHDGACADCDESTPCATGW